MKEATMSTQPVRLAVIGGSGLYAMPDLTEIESLSIDTPFGKPSGEIVIGTLGGERVAFLARHGSGHVYSPSEVPYRANMYALKTLGVEQIIAVSACGSLREDYAPGDMVIPGQLFDHTKDIRGRTFFENGLVAHVAVTDPFCPDLSREVAQSVERAGGRVHEGGIFITIEGPRFSSKGESNIFRSWGISIIGMTTSPEAYLAREAEMCYSVMAHVTDYDVWHETEEPVSVEMVIRTSQKNLAIAQSAISAAIPQLAKRKRACVCPHALDEALVTDRKQVPPETLERLRPILGDHYS